MCAAILVIAFWPRIEPSATMAKAAVEQPVFVVASAPAQKPTTIAARPIAKEALSKLASALRGPTQDTAPILSLTIPIDDAKRLCAEGLIAFAQGDIAAARAYLQRAAESGDPRALMALGDTYDPMTLGRLGAMGIKGDEATARSYYSRALTAGVGGARERIAALASK
jgi:TPR repeat protein